jgi:hypothetical protein
VWQALHLLKAFSPAAASPSAKALETGVAANIVAAIKMAFRVVILTLLCASIDESWP